MSTISPEDFFPDDTEDWPDPEDEYPEGDLAEDLAHEEGPPF